MIAHRTTPLFAAAVLLGVGGAPLAAQDRTAVFLPDIRYFQGPLADPIEPRSGAGFLLTNVLRTRGQERPPFIVPDSARAAREVQGSARIGATLPLARLAQWADGGAVLSGQAGIDARFRIERPSRDDMSQDWFVAIPIELRRGDWSGRVRISHRSSHLGDEFMEQTGARRIEFGGESVDAMGARRVGPTRVYAGGSWIFRSYTRREPVMRQLRRSDRFVVQLGADGGWLPDALAGARVQAAIDVQLAERTAWQRQLAALAGLRWAGARHALQLNLRAYDGPSAMGEFFLTPERYLALEFVAEL